MEQANQRPVMDVARPPQKSAVPTDTPPAPRAVSAVPATTRPLMAEQSGVRAATPTPPQETPMPKPVVSAPTPAPQQTTVEAPVQAQPVASPSLSVRQAPKEDTAAPTGVKSPQQKTEPAQSSPKPKPTPGQHGPIGAIVVTVLMMLALSALAIVIYLNT